MSTVKSKTKISLAAFDNCCGCASCSVSCPINCISMISDVEGFLRPQIDESKCIACRTCQRACPLLNPITQQQPSEFYAAWSGDKDIRKLSSSGGVFWHLAHSVLMRNGLVAGVILDIEQHAKHIIIDSHDDLLSLLGSKYLQSDKGDVFLQVYNALNSQRHVLFSGTPCEVAALKSFLRAKGQGSELSHLFTVDFICHGAPSPKVWDTYHHKLFGKNIPAKISFRDKTYGWHSFSLRVEDKNHDLLFIQKFGDNPYMNLFLRDIILRPSCYNCAFRQNHHLSDITVGDLWGVEKRYPEWDDDGGISSVVINTHKGKTLFESCTGLVKHSISKEAVIGGNPSYSNIPKIPWQRKWFWKEFNSAADKMHIINRFGSVHRMDFRSRLLRFLRRKQYRLREISIINISRYIFNR